MIEISLIHRHIFLLYYIIVDYHSEISLLISSRKSATMSRWNQLSNPFPTKSFIIAQQIRRPINSRLDIRANGFLTRSQEAFFNVRIFILTLPLTDPKPLQQHSRSTKMRRSENLVNVLERWNKEYSLHLFSPHMVVCYKSAQPSTRACPHDSRQEQPAICNCNELAKMQDPLCSHPHGYYVHQGKSLNSPSSNLRHQYKFWQYPPGVR